MDNGTHTLCGLALARMGGERLGPLATPTLVIAANFPDSDVVGAIWGGQPWYLCHHRGLTHALVGLAVEAVLLGLVMTWIGRRWCAGASASGHRPLPERPRAGGLIVAAALGLLSHLALDGLNTYGIRPWLPFVDTWYYGDTAFIADPWMWLMFGAAACLGAPAVERSKPAAAPDPLAKAERAAEVGAHDAARELALAALPAPGQDREVLRDATTLGRRVADAAWWTLTALVILLILGNERGVPRVAALLWGVPMVGVLVARARGLTARRRHVVAALCALLALPYLGAMRALDAAALERARAWAREQGHPPVEAGVCHPTPVVPWRFHAVIVCGEWIHDVDVDLRRDEAWLRTSVQRNLDDPALGDPAVTSTPEYSAWRTFARVPFTARTTDEHLILGDARYAPRPARSWCNLAVPLPE